MLDARAVLDAETVLDAQPMLDSVDVSAVSQHEAVLVLKQY